MTNSISASLVARYLIFVPDVESIFRPPGKRVREKNNVMFAQVGKLLLEAINYSCIYLSLIFGAFFIWSTCIRYVDTFA